MILPILQLSDTDRGRLEQILVEFDQNWTPHHLGNLAGPLESESRDFKAAALTELAKIDLDFRQRQEPTRIEWYLERFPELGESTATLSELLQAEIALRQTAGDTPTTVELQLRFPSLHDQVAGLIANAVEQDEFSAIRRGKRQDSDNGSTSEGSDSTTSIASAALETLPPNHRRQNTREESSDDAPQEFGRYRLLQELGRGAMGTVYLAEDTELRRRVALKRPRVAGTDEASLLARFYREAHAAATLDHPNICPVYDIGQHEGVPYITMAYVEGKPLSRVIRESRGLNPRAVAVLLRKVAVALAEAHAKGVIHRDLKPGNIMLNHRSEPIIMDFGLARQVEDVKDRLTVDGTLIGTPGYMSPEQVEGDLQAVGPASDIYSLGVVLFELLTGKLPFQGSVAAVIGKIVRDQPPAPSTLRAGVPQQLEEICMKMMAKLPTDRPATMGEVAEALGAFIKSSGEGASATAPPPIEPITLAQLNEQQTQLAQMIADGQWREASVHLQRMSELQEPAAAPYANWAREQTATLHVRWQEEQEAASRACGAAKEQFKRQDYVGASQTLLAVNKQLVTVEGERLLDESLKLQEEVDLLIHLIEQGLSGGNQAGMFRNMQRLLELKPKDRLVRDLYRKFHWQQRLGWFGAMLADAVSLAPRRTRSMHDEPLLRKWFAWAALVGLISFGLMSWAMIIYLRGDKQTVQVEIDDAWLQEQGGQLSLTVDDNEHTLTGSVLDIKVTLGDHGFSVKNGDNFVHNPQTFTIEKEGRKVLQISGSGMRLADGAGSPNLSPKTEFASQEWIDVLRLIDTQRDKAASNAMWTGMNDWRLSNDELSYVSDGSHGKFRLPLAINGSSVEYDIEFTAESRPNAKDYGFNIHFPAKSGWFAVGLETPVETHLGTIQIGTLAESPLKSFRVNDGQKTRLVLKLVRLDKDRDHLTVRANGTSLGEWTGNRESVVFKKELSPTEWAPEYLDIDVSQGTNITFHSFKLRVLDGTATRKSDWTRVVRAIQSVGKLPTEAVQGAMWQSGPGKQQFIWCPPGKFRMGSGETPLPDANETPVDVTLTQGLWVSNVEVTQAQWKAVMETDPWKAFQDHRDGPIHAATHVTWTEAVEFCRKLTESERKAGNLPADWAFRLPTEAEWEYFARAGTTTKYSFGNDDKQLTDHAWWRDNAEAKGEKFAHEVGKFKPNPWGLYDIHGNVYEWCQDTFTVSLPGGIDPLVTDPANGNRVNRGGGWDGRDELAHTSSNRRWTPHNERRNNLGLRVVISPSPVSSDSPLPQAPAPDSS